MLAHSLFAGYPVDKGKGSGKGIILASAYIYKSTLYLCITDACIYMLAHSHFAGAAVKGGGGAVQGQGPTDTLNVKGK